MPERQEEVPAGKLLTAKMNPVYVVVEDGGGQKRPRDINNMIDILPSGGQIVIVDMSVAGRVGFPSKA